MSSIQSMFVWMLFIMSCLLYVAHVVLCDYVHITAATSHACCVGCFLARSIVSKVTNGNYVIMFVTVVPIAYIHNSNITFNQRMT